MKLLEKEIKAKWKKSNILEMNTKYFTEKFEETISSLDVSLKFNWFLATNDKALLYHGRIQKRKSKNVSF